MLLDTVSDLVDLTRWRGRCVRIYSYVCRYCGIVHVEGEGYTAVARIGQREADRQVVGVEDGGPGTAPPVGEWIVLWGRLRPKCILFLWSVI